MIPKQKHLLLPYLAVLPGGLGVGEVLPLDVVVRVLGLRLGVLPVHNPLYGGVAGQQVLLHLQLALHVLHVLGVAPPLPVEELLLLLHIVLHLLQALSQTTLLSDSISSVFRVPDLLAIGF
jgi:hypothetical protein